MLQAYTNDSNEAIEAKYVFPLDDLAVVCGFEAFINDKHIIGEVKEKETAHKEYKKAISEGHGAYLMDQDEETPVSRIETFKDGRKGIKTYSTRLYSSPQLRRECSLV